MCYSPVSSSSSRGRRPAGEAGKPARLSRLPPCQGPISLCQAITYGISTAHVRLFGRAPCRAGPILPNAARESTAVTRIWGLPQATKKGGALLKGAIPASSTSTSTNISMSLRCGRAPVPGKAEARFLPRPSLQGAQRSSVPSLFGRARGGRDVAAPTSQNGRDACLSAKSRRIGPSARQTGIARGKRTRQVPAQQERLGIRQRRSAGQYPFRQMREGGQTHPEQRFFVQTNRHRLSPQPRAALRRREG